ncbi:MAG: transcription antitermination factor NusB [Armatimonadota bacterium]
MGTSSRRAARELALNVLYQVDVAKLPLDDALRVALENTKLDRSAAEYTTNLVKGVESNINNIDNCLMKLSVGWELQRQPAVDRNILRIAIYEIQYIESVPNSVSINEAVELAKKFSTEDSGKFVNGVLGALVRQDQGREES